MLAPVARTVGWLASHGSSVGLAGLSGSAGDGKRCGMWIVGVVVVVVIAACVAAIFLAGGDQGPLLSLSKFGSTGKITSSRGRTDFHDDLRKPPNENELL
jgi:hypothetical protein